jgi:hypothetical protein
VLIPHKRPNPGNKVPMKRQIRLNVSTIFVNKKIKKNKSRVSRNIPKLVSDISKEILWALIFQANGSIFLCVNNVIPDDGLVCWLFSTNETRHEHRVDDQTL